MPTPTYDLIATTTLAATSPEVVFGSIPQGYRDLILVLAVSSAGGNQLARLRFNSDSGSNYSRLFMRGDGSSATSSADPDTGIFGADVDSTNKHAQVINIMDYSATDKHKTVINRTNRGDRVQAFAQRWSNNSAITSVRVVIASGTFNAGNTFSLYGIAS
jgi:hypothetical protein